jgi:hypothetical protein
MFYDGVTDFYVPALYILLTSKESHLYKLAFSSVLSVLGFKPHISSITCDYKIALQSAAKGIFS